MFSFFLNYSYNISHIFSRKIPPKDHSSLVSSVSVFVWRNATCSWLEFSLGVVVVFVVISSFSRFSSSLLVLTLLRLAASCPEWRSSSSSWAFGGCGGGTFVRLSSPIKQRLSYVILSNAVTVCQLTFRWEQSKA